jgi:hypothetical protein
MFSIIGEITSDNPERFKIITCVLPVRHAPDQLINLRRYKLTT